MEELGKYSLHMNVLKSQILKGSPAIEHLKNVEGIPIVPHVKYLGYDIYPTKTKIF